MWDFFERRICLTADDAEWKIAQEEFKRVGLKVEKFTAIPHIGPHQSFNCSVRQILIDFLESPSETLLMTEDDCVFKALNHLPNAVSEVPKGWDILYLGANIKDEKPVKISTNIYKVSDAWTTHCIAYNKKVVPFILENQPGFSEKMFDCWQGEFVLPKVNSYVVNPMVAWQRPRISKIWGHMVDYSEQFRESQNKLV